MSHELDIAVVGMAGRFPGAATLEEFWRNLAAGVDSITHFSDEELRRAGVSDSLLKDPNYVKAAPVLENPAAFDAEFFGILPIEARTLDPQHRLLLELAWESLEDAGYDTERFAGRVGVFSGSAFNTYFMDRGLRHQFAQAYIPTLLDSDKDFLSTRISYKLNLKGPSLTVQTACSTSMVAVHLARQSLLSGECDMALAGATSVRVPHRAGYFCDTGGVVSPDGRVRPFDAGANGTVFGSGGGMMVLKRLADALADGDHIRAVIKGSAVNNDGSEKAGYTTPSVNGQADVVMEALANADVDAAEISYLEAHGSGTPVGDPIEVHALTKAFRSFTQKSGYCALGSVKGNVGHLDAAAAVTGMIKTVLALEQRLIPPSLHFEKANPEIDFAHTPFYVNAQAQEWKAQSARRAGVMSTGMGGTNAHVILEEAPELPQRTPTDSPQLLVVSARTASALAQATARLTKSLEQNPDRALADVAHTLRVGRRGFAHRCSLVATSVDDATGALRESDSRRVVTAVQEDPLPRPVVFLLPGIGDHYVGMAHGLYEGWSSFRKDVDRCAEILKPYLDCDIRAILYPAGEPWKKGGAAGIDLKKMLGARGDAAADPDAEKLNQTLYAQPAQFTVEYALARLWQSLGVQPAALVGHSMGEYVAACLAGVMSLEDALRVIAARARLVQELPQGAMLAVPMPELALRPLLDPAVSISLINGPALCVVAGPPEAIAELEKRLDAREILYRRVQNAHAFHSRMLTPIVRALEDEVRKIRLRPPQIPFISNVTGTWITAEAATDPAYWARHADHTARFSDALQAMWLMDRPLLVEAGPGRTLGVLAMQHPAVQGVANPVTVASLRHHYEGQPDAAYFLNAVGKLWRSGVPMRWEQMQGEDAARRVPLPTYPFERRDYWIGKPLDGPRASSAPAASQGAAPLRDWFYTVAWQRTSFASDLGSSPLPEAFWLVIADRHGGGEAIRTRLEARGAAVALVRFGEGFAAHADGSYDIPADSSEAYRTLLTAVEQRAAGRPLHVVHLGSLVRSQAEALDVSPAAQDFGFYSLLQLAQALGELHSPLRAVIGVVSNRLHAVTGEEDIAPAMATVLGPCGVIPKEYPNVRCFNLDLAGDQPVDSLPPLTLDRMLAEFTAPHGSRLIAYRGRYRWERNTEHVAIDDPGMPGVAWSRPRLKPDGVYLITGGTGGIGLAIAAYLARHGQPRLMLTRKSPFPEKSRWPVMLGWPETSFTERRTIAALQELERQGASVDVMPANVTDRGQMQLVIDSMLQRYGRIDGVIHGAGIVRAGLIQTKTREVADSVLAPKVAGTALLFELLRPVQPDFLVLFSSITSLLTPYAESDYSAANCFLDVFSAYANAHGIRTLSINWPGWREAGQLADLVVRPGLEGWKEAALRKAIATRDGVEAFHRALHSNLSQVIVSPENLSQLMMESEAEFDPSQYLDQAQPGALRAADPDAPPARQNTVESTLLEMWRGMFGLHRIDVHEPFISLGGHSLLAMQIVARIRSSYQIPFTVRDFFENSTIAQLSELIEKRVRSEIESLSEEQIRWLISNE